MHHYVNQVRKNWLPQFFSTFRKWHKYLPMPNLSTYTCKALSFGCKIGLKLMCLKKIATSLQHHYSGRFCEGKMLGNKSATLYLVLKSMRQDYGILQSDLQASVEYFYRRKVALECWKNIVTREVTSHKSWIFF